MPARRFLAAAMAALILLAGCGSAPAVRTLAVPPSGPVTWNGTALEGIPFYERRTRNVVVHYAPMTTPAQAEGIAQAAQAFLDDLAKQGRCCTAVPVEIWMLPPGNRWPDSVPLDVGGMRALGDHKLLMYSMPVETGPQSMFLTVITLTMQLPAGHPALASDWLHTGHGQILAWEPDKLPVTAWHGWMDSKEMLQNLKGPPASYEFYRASVSLAGLLADRWGLNWPLRYSGDWSPEALLLWSTGAADVDSAFALWGDRVRYIRFNHWTNVGSGKYWVTSAADMSPVRLEPKLAPLPPGPGAEGNRSPHRYDIDARYDPLLAEVRGTVRLTWRNGESIPVDRLYFNLWPNAEQFTALGGSMSVSAAAVDGQATPFEAAGLDLAVTLPAPVGPDQETTVSVDFTTRLPLSLKGRLLGQQGTERFQLVYWHPELAVLDDRGWHLTALPSAFGDPYSEHADYTVQMDVPAQTTVAATGQMLAREEQEGRWIYRFAADKVTHWAAHGGTAVPEQVRQVGPVLVRVLDSDKDRGARLLAEAERVLPLFAQWFGPYPYPQLVIGYGAQTAMPGLVGLSYFDESGNWKGQFYQVVAHQWFGVAVGSDQWGEPWLDEGFARYAARRAMRNQGQTQLLTDLRRITLTGPQKVNSPTTEFLRYGQYAEGTQELGARVAEELEAMLGRSDMDRLLRTWVERYRFKTATTADFIALAEEVAGRDLSQFFAEFGVDPAVREPYVPVLPPGKVTLP